MLYRLLGVSVWPGGTSIAFSYWYIFVSFHPDDNSYSLLLLVDTCVPLSRQDSSLSYFIGLCICTSIRMGLFGDNEDKDYNQDEVKDKYKKWDPIYHLTFRFHCYPVTHYIRNTLIFYTILLKVKSTYPNDHKTVTQLSAGARENRPIGR